MLSNKQPENGTSNLSADHADELQAPNAESPNGPDQGPIIENDDPNLPSEPYRQPQERLEAIAKEREKEVIERKKQTLPTLIWDFTVGALMELPNSFRYPFWAATYNLFIGGVSALLWTLARKLYVAYCLKQYEANRPIENPEEKAAFIKGTKSAGLIKYYLSYFNLNAWKHPIAFTTGLTLKNSEFDETKLSALLGRPPLETRPYAFKITVTQRKTFSSFLPTAASSFLNKFFTPAKPVSRSTWIIFENEKDLKRQLLPFLGTYFSSVSYWTQACNVQLNFDPNLADLPEDIRTYLHNTLRALLPVKSIEITAQDENALNSLDVKEILAHHQQEVHRRNKYFGIKVLMGANLALGASLLLGSPLLLIASNMLTLSALGALIHITKQSYLDYAKQSYNNHRKIEKASLGEIEALKYGAEAARSWKGFFNQYVQPSCYAHPIAAAAGMAHGLEKNEPLLNKIRSNRPS